MQYYEHFGLSYDPFLKNTLLGHQSYQSRDFQNAYDILNAGVKRNGVVLLTAIPGLGKSHSIDRFLADLDKAKHPAAYVCAALSSPTEFYRQVAIELGLDPTGNKQRIMNRIKAHIYSLYKRGRVLVLIIDEAQDLKLSILQELHIFLNFEHDSTDACTLVLSGGPTLSKTISTSEKLVALKQRITNHYDFIGLSDDEIPLYLKHKLDFAGGTSTLIDSDAVPILCSASCGISRTIDHIMTDALAYGAQIGRTRIDSEIMQVAADNQLIAEKNQFAVKSSSRKTATP